MDNDLIKRMRKLSQQYAYTSLQMHETIGQKAGLSGTDHKYLGFLIEKGQMTAGELSNLTGLTTGAVTGLIDRFEKKKLVKRVFAEDDRRKVIIEPNTEKIMALLYHFIKNSETSQKTLLLHFQTRKSKSLKPTF